MTRIVSIRKSISLQPPAAEISRVTCARFFGFTLSWSSGVSSTTRFDHPRSSWAVEVVCCVRLCGCTHAELIPVLLLHLLLSHKRKVDYDTRPTPLAPPAASHFMVYAETPNGLVPHYADVDRDDRLDSVNRIARTDLSAGAPGPFGKGISTDAYVTLASRHAHHSSAPLPAACTRLALSIFWTHLLTRLSASVQLCPGCCRRRRRERVDRRRDPRAPRRD